MEQKVFGLPLWVAVIALGGAGVVGYLIFFRNSGSSQSSGGGTTGYSAQGLAVMQNPDESATMADQNRLLYQVQNSLAGIGDQITGVGGQVTDLSNSQSSGFLGVSNSLNGLSGQVSGVSNQVGGLSNQDAAYYNSLLTSLQNAANSISQQMQQSNGQNAAYYQGLLQSIQNYAATLSSQMSTVSGQVSGVAQQENQTQSMVGALPNPAAFYRLSAADQQPYLNVEHGDFQKAATHWANDAAAAVLNFQAQHPQLTGNTRYPGFTS